MSPELPKAPRAHSRWKMPLAAVVFIGATTFIGFTGIECREQTLASLRIKSAERSIPTVAASTPIVQKSIASLDLPGRLDAYSRAAIFARVSGYVASRKVDIGTRVKAGDLLAEIDAPDLDQQLFQAQFDLNNAKTNAALAKVTNERYQALLPKDWVTRQGADEKAAE